MAARHDVSVIEPDSDRAASDEQTWRHDAPIDVRIEPLQDVAGLETSWKELEERATRSFYLSWLWIGTWLKHLPRGAQPHVLVARISGRTVGLAIVCQRTVWSFGPQGRARWLLNETGDARFDRLFIEYNGILAERALVAPVTAACLDALAHSLSVSDELVLSGIDLNFETVASRAAGGAGLLTEVRAADVARWVDFTKIREKSGDYRASLGRSTRQAVNRAIRLYAERGPVQFRVMETTAEALAAFDVLAGFHQSRWGSKGSFANPGFRPFHEDLIARGVPVGAIRISRTLAGEQTIGVLYNFVHDGHVLNYQSGFLYEPDGRLKPGLVSHVLSIEDSMLRGEYGYDFLAGFARHKSQLANAEHAMTWSVIGRDTLERRIEARIRRAKQALGQLLRKQMNGRTAALPTGHDDGRSPQAVQGP
ncbi:GNAT family N-acetyltransferase [Bradyrhizobium acaciae]|uniref:GNAT family N-acetyltransferase n=1 Tax=Bradyrhizobium acaciae TaxID=2683706 RepID=UPI001E5B722E|nr:GNAT family N-acetyltransferase [Bradyrhizobium acaciae]MCC8980019.1 GNAT family N-acetyltransferase [Bradyrhizobium acaciae]